MYHGTVVLTALKEFFFVINSISSFPVKQNTELEFVLKLCQLKAGLLPLPTAPTSVGNTDCLLWLHSLGISTIPTQ